MLNPALYAVLASRYGPVKLTNEGVRRVAYRREGSTTTEVPERGEHLNLDCPICGDTRGRLSISYMWLTKDMFTRDRCTHLIHCYNEECEELRTKEFYEPLLEDLELAELGLIKVPDFTEVSSLKVQTTAIDLPDGLVPIDELSDTHEASIFLEAKYGIPRHYLASVYGVSYCTKSTRYPLASNSVVFPIEKENKLTAWQARSVDPTAVKRWYNPPGFVAGIYNVDRVPASLIPVINEGIPGAITCGPTGVCIFGKSLNAARCKEFGERWDTVIVATDPETYVPDNRKGGGGRIFADEMIEGLSKHVNCVTPIEWPAEVLDLATRHNNGEDVSVPDAADLGMVKMREIIEKAL